MSTHTQDKVRIILRRILAQTEESGVLIRVLTILILIIIHLTREMLW